MRLPDLEHVRSDIQRVTELFTAQGYERVLSDQIDLDDTSLRIRNAISSWFASAERRSSDCVVIYYGGHGDEGGQFQHHYLFTIESTEARIGDTAIKTKDLVESLFQGNEDTCPQNVLLILDTCYANVGGRQISQVLSELKGVAPIGSGFWVILSSDAKTEAGDGAFVEALCTVLHPERTEWQHDGAFLPIETLISRINHHFETTGQAQRAIADGRGIQQKTRFFRNPRSRLTQSTASLTPLGQHNISSEPLIVQLQSGETTSQASVPYFYPPDLGTSTFIGRTKELQQLHELLQASPRVGIVAATGMGGIGKTQFAWQYAHQHRGDYPGGIWWLTGARLVKDVLTCRIRMKLPEAPDNLDSDDARVQWYYDRWVDVLPEGMRLLIWDDVSDYGSVRSLLPQDERYRVLLTTREKLSLPVQRLELGVLKLEESLELLRRLVGDDNRIAAEVEIAQALCEWVGCLPLGIELVGRHLAGRPTMKLSTLLSRLEEQRLRAKAAQQVPSEMPYRDNLEAAFELSWRLLDETAKQLGGLLSVFALAPVKQEWVAASLKGWDEEKIEEAEGALFRWSLVSLKSGQYLLHTLIREFFAQKLIGELKSEAEGLQKGMIAAMVAEAKKVEVPEDITRHHLYDLSPIIPHLEEAVKKLIDFIEEDFVLLFQGIGRYYEGQGLYNLAEKIYKDCQEKSQKRFGFNHLNTLRASYELARVYHVQGNYDEAEELQREALSNEVFTNEFILSSERLLLADVLNSLGLTLKAKGNYSEAEELYNRSLEIRTNLLESGHLDISDSLNNLALLYGARNRYQDAEPLLIEALRIRKNKLGNHHLRVASSLNNLAYCYYGQKQKRFEEAEQLYSQALAIYRDLHEREHQDIAKVLNNLALLYMKQDKFKAEPLFLEALEIQKLVLGEMHPDIVSCFSNIAGLYEDLDNATKAESFYKKALNMGQELLGEDHISVAITLNNLAKLYQNNQKCVEAEPLYVESLKILESKLGEDHDISIKVKDNLNSLRATLKENNLQA
jgi:tetratricopeptide (TPR) repeat protein